MVGESTQVFVNVVWEVLNIIKENMPAHFEIGFEGPLARSCIMGSSSFDGEASSNREIAEALAAEQEILLAEQYRRQISCLHSLQEALKADKRSLSKDEVLDCVYTLSHSIWLKEAKG